jgi:hypothetical protein
MVVDHLSEGAVHPRRVNRDMKLSSILLGWSRILTKFCVSPQVASAKAAALTSPGLADIQNVALEARNSSQVVFHKRRELVRPADAERAAADERGLTLPSQPT